MLNFSHVVFFPSEIFPSILFSARPLFHVDFLHVARFPYGIFPERDPPTRPLACRTLPTRSVSMGDPSHEDTPAPSPPQAHLSPRNNSRLARASPRPRIFIYFSMISFRFSCKHPAHASDIPPLSSTRVPVHDVFSKSFCKNV